MGGAAAEPTSGKGGKKALDANINLVPYIDMLMTIMTFLMMTAVWTQIAMLEVQNASGGPEDQQTEPDPDRPKAVLVLASKDSITVQEEGAEPRTFPATADGYDFKGVQVEMQRLKDARSDRQEVKIQSEDGVLYQNLTSIIDIATGVDMKQITLTPMGQ
jgi:biopolymer transport protein ExbD